MHIASDGYLRNKLAPFRQRTGIEVRGGQPRETSGRIERWIKYYRAHFGFQTKRGAMNASVRRYLEIGDSFVSDPSAAMVPVLPEVLRDNRANMRDARHVLQAEIGTRIATNAHLALDRIEHALGLLDTGGYQVDRAVYSASPLYQRFTVAPTGAGMIASIAATITLRRDVDLHTDDNVLYRLLRQAERLFASSIDGTPEKKLVDRLRSLIDFKRLKFSANEWPSKEDELHAFAMIQLRKIAHDLAIGLTATSHVNDRLAPASGMRRAARAQDVARGIALDYAKQIDSDKDAVNWQFKKGENLKVFSASLQNIQRGAVEQQLATDVRELISLTPTLGAVKRLRAPAYDRFMHAYRQNAALAIERLEGALGLADNWRKRRAGLNDELQPNAAFWRFCQREALVWTPSNVLYLLFDRRSRALHGIPAAPLEASPYPDDDLEAAIPLGGFVRIPPPSLDQRGDDGELTARLGHLLDLGIYLPAPPMGAKTAEIRVRQMPGSFPESEAPDEHDEPEHEAVHLDNASPRHVVNEFGVLTGHLIRGQKFLELVAQHPDGDPVSEEIERYTTLIQSKGDDALSLLFNKGLYDPAAQEAFAHFQQHSLLAQHPERAIRRAATFEGMLAEEDQVEHYRQAFLALKTGDGLMLEESWHGGFDADGTGVVLSLTDRLTQGRPESLDPNKNVLNIPFNIVPNLTWEPYLGHSNGHRVAITRTSDGVDISLGHISENVLKLGGFKAMWGAGRFAQDFAQGRLSDRATTALGLGYAGFEILPNFLSVSRRADGEIVFHIRNDDHGSAAYVVSLLMAGQITASDLLNAAATLSQRSTASDSLEAGLDVHALIAAVGIFTPASNLHQRFKSVGAGLYQVSGALKSARSTGKRQSSEGVQYISAPRDLTVSGNHKVIGVAEIQGSYIKDARSPMPPHSVVGGLLEVQEKVPVWIDLMIRPFGPPKQLKIAPIITSSADGRVDHVSYSLHLGRGGGGLDATRIPQLMHLRLEAPEVERRLTAIASRAAAMKLPVQVEVELNQKGLALINETHAAKANIRAIVDDPHMWRLKSLSVRKAQGYTTRLFTGLAPARYRSEATNTWSQVVGSVMLHYQNGLIAATVHDGLTKSDSRARFDLLHRLSDTRLAEVIYGVDEGVRHALSLMQRGVTTLEEILDLAPQWIAADKYPREKKDHLALRQGEIVFRTWTYNGWREAALPQLLLQHMFEPVDPRRARAVLALMSAGRSGWLLNIAPSFFISESSMTDLRRTAVPCAAETPMPENRTGRPLHVLDILELTKSPDFFAQLDPAQRCVLASHFPNSVGELDLGLLREVVNAPDLVACFRRNLEFASGRLIDTQHAHLGSEDAEVAPPSPPHTPVYVQSPSGLV
jgi:hypothetical protein